MKSLYVSAPLPMDRWKVHIRSFANQILALVVFNFMQVGMFMLTFLSKVIRKAKGGSNKSEFKIIQDEKIVKVFGHI